MTLTCTNCLCSKRIWSGPNFDESHTGINVAAVVGTIKTGVGFYQLEELCAAMNIPCMAGTTYRRYHESVHASFVDAVEESMAKAKELEVRLAHERNDFKSGFACTKVIADGTWLKRSYTGGKFDSNSGAGVIIGYYSKQVLFIGIRNKYCFVCSRAEKKRKKNKTAHLL